MIISASRRTDIPALYPQWFMNRLRAGEVLVPNPYNRRKVSRIRLSPEWVDGIVFWTKNPEPLLPYLRELDAMGYRYCFQYTITDYGEDLEPEVPRTEEAMATFLLLSQRLGKERINWRFDPILLTEKYTISYHLEQFEMMCQWLGNATGRCTISFVDEYRGSDCRELEIEEIWKLAEGLSQISKKYGIPLYTCAEQLDLSRYGIYHGACIDQEQLRQLAGYKLDLKRDKGQRKGCRCAESFDIGMYDTCVNGCRYCYAVSGREGARKKYNNHDPESPFLIGHFRGDEEIIDRKAASARDDQISLFDLPQMRKDI
ncbi:DUF1848 domain-containing protein [Lachnospiraceae bacterium KGMB03038]|nr:DUF1848 domain-containing protein [Lachnospiraceae bacterium KGMB03038]